MPNWVHNTIVCKHNLAKTILNFNGEVDFGILVREPATKEECVSLYGEKYLDGVDEKGHSIHSLSHEDGKDWFNWYDWSVAFWGTKWNACDSYYLESDNGYLEIHFDTAWAPPRKWIEALERTGEPFILKWTEEQGYGGNEGYNGKNDIDVNSQWGYYEGEEDDKENDSINRELPSDEDIVKFLGL